MTKICILVLLIESSGLCIDFEISARKYVRPPSQDFFETVKRPRRIYNQLSAEQLDPQKGPEIRIALAIDASSATVTSTQPMIAYAAETTNLVGLDTLQATVKLEGESKRSTATYRVQVSGLRSRKEAEAAAKNILQQFDEKIEKNYDDKQAVYKLKVGEYRSQRDAQIMLVRLKDAGYKAASLVRSDSMSSVSAIVFSSQGERLLSSQKSITFVPGSPGAVLQFSAKAYRGKIQVVINQRGRLNVINFVQMEDYLRGVVPNELSPKAFPELEALKAQAVAARTYAIHNRGQFASEGYDLLSTALSQVYAGIDSEHPLSNKAVEETEGIVATYGSEPINALYTSTCGGHTESSENVFTKAVPYLVGVPCVVQRRSRRATENTLQTKREMKVLLGDYGRPMTREAAILAVLGLPLPESIDDEYLRQHPTQREVARWLIHISKLLHRKSPELPDNLVLLAGFAEGLEQAVYGSESPSRLLTDADAEYILGSEAGKFSPSTRKTIAALTSEGILTAAPDGSFKDRISRATALSAIFQSLARLNLPMLQTGSLRSIEANRLRLKLADKETDVELGHRLYLFRVIKESYLPASLVRIVGGEKVVFHKDDSGQIDYLEVHLNANGAANDRFSIYSRWQMRYTAQELRAKLLEEKVNVGEIIDLVPVRYGVSNRIVELRVIGSQKEQTLSKLRIRSALGLRENLFIIEREYSQTGQIVAYHFIGRGWGHGVGLCQVGAYGLARKGFSYEEILKSYYSGIQLSKVY